MSEPGGGLSRKQRAAMTIKVRLAKMGKEIDYREKHLYLMRVERLQPD